MEEEYNSQNVIAEVDETLGHKLKRAKEEDKMIEDYDVMQEVMEEEKVVGMEPTVIEEDNESRSERSAAEAAED